MSIYYQNLIFIATAKSGFDHAKNWSQDT